MKTIIIIFYLVSLPAYLYAARPSETNPERKAVTEFVMRSGLPHFFKKAAHADSVKVAYLGGSITAQNGWRIYSLEWFRELYPQAVFSEINAAIGGTASDFGAFRLQDQVLSSDPDLVFIEFAVNDSNKPEKRIIRSMEGIVRKIWEDNPEIDICFVYTIKNDYIETEMAGNLPPSAVAMEKVADQYGIPSINFGNEVCQLIHNHQLIFKGAEKKLDDIPVFSPDGVHPYPETGHRIYLNTLKRSFEKMRKKKSASLKKHILPQPVDPDYFSNPQMPDFTKANLSGNWQIINTKDDPLLSKFSHHLNKIGKAQASATLSFRFKGKAIGIYDIMGPGAGKVVLEIDGSYKDTIYRFDEYCTYSRMNYLLFDDLEDQEHDVVFKVLPDPIDKAAILAKRGNTIKNARDYEENNWYVGKLLIDGFLLP